MRARFWMTLFSLRMFLYLRPHLPLKAKRYGQNAQEGWAFGVDGVPRPLSAHSSRESERVRCGDARHHDHKILEEKLSALVLTDGPKGLLNAHAFQGALDQEWKRALRGGSQLSLLMIDIVRLKSQPRRVKSRKETPGCAPCYGVSGVVRTTDFVARHGGRDRCHSSLCRYRPARPGCRKVRSASSLLSLPTVKKKKAAG